MSEIRSEPLDVDSPVSSPATDGGGASTSTRPHWVTFVGLALLIIAADQLTKAWLVSFLAPGQMVNVLGDWIRLVHSQNSGGLFGLLRGQALPFGLVSLVVVGLIVVYHGRSKPNRYVSITLGLLLGGAAGNLIDRLRIGYVVDFVDAGIGDLRWYTFNVADAAISFAILLLLAASVWPAVARRAGVDA
ncbi:MAG: signal peptidase II [Candidatus Limnocylindrales bacterium]